MDCFKKVLKLAEAAVSAQPDANSFKIYLLLLNKFLYFLQAENFNAVRDIDSFKFFTISFDGK